MKLFLNYGEFKYFKQINSHVHSSMKLFLVVFYPIFGWGYHNLSRFLTIFLVGKFAEWDKLAEMKENDPAHNGNRGISPYSWRENSRNEKILQK